MWAAEAGPTPHCTPAAAIRECPLHRILYHLVDGIDQDFLN